MNDQELYDNFLYACVTYANDNGTHVDDPNSLCELYDDGMGSISITAWYHNSTQPSNEDLKAYTLEQVQHTATVYQNQQKLNETLMLSFTTTERDELTPEEGVIIYNKTTQTIQVYTDSWKDVNFAS
jgi:hypothetical protein